MAPSTFADVTAVSELRVGQFAATVDARWTIAQKPNGGYLLALLGRAVTRVSAHLHVVAVSCHYLHSPEPGAVVIDVDILRSGRSASQLRARMTQGDQVCLEALFTTSELHADAADFWTGGVPDLEVAPRDRCQRIPAVTPTGLSSRMMGEIDLRIDPADLGFAAGRPSGRGQLRGWLALPEDEPFDPVSLIYAVDAFPPATFEISPTGWVPTLELTVYIRSLPAPGPVRVLQRAQMITAQRVDEICYVWDSTGRLVAHGVQLAAIRLG